jgi:periplasmic copper chaperone A
MKIAWIAAAAGLMFATSAAGAQEYKVGSMTVGQVWARPTAGPNKMGAAYLALKNGGKEADTLKSASSPDAAKVELHEHIHENGVMKMREVAGGIAIPAGGTVTFQPGGYHIMLMGLKRDLQEGKTLPLKLSFARAGDVDVQVKIAKTPSSAGSHEQHR